VVAEAYRHLVDPVVDDPEIVAHLAPRVLVTCQVGVSNVLDLRTSRARVELNLPMEVLTSATHDKKAYERCRNVAGAAHQQGFHGLVAPAATGLGETLALFSDRLPPDELPELVEYALWETLPNDPRDRGRGGLTVVRD